MNWQGRAAARILVFLSILQLIGCQRKPEADRPQVAATLSEKFAVGIAGWGDLSTLDPARAGVTAPIMVVWHTHQRLVGIDEQGRPIPMLASSWVSSPDLREWRFTINPDAYFHASQGSPARRVTADDAKASIERALKIPGFAQGLLSDVVIGAEDFISGRTVKLEGLTATPNSLVFHLSRPFAFLPERLSASFLSIVPADTPPDPAVPPVGSGPYRLIEWNKSANKVILERVSSATQPNSPRRLIFYVFSSEAVAVEELVAGNLDWVETTSTALPIMRERKGISLILPDQTTMRLVALNVTQKPFKDSGEIGRALNYATNRKQLVQFLGGGSVASGPVPGSSAGELPFDFNKAQHILSQQPANSQAFELLVQPGEESRLIAEIIQRQWSAAGFKVTLKAGVADFFDRVVQGRYQAALGYYGPFVPSAEQYLWLYRSSAQPVPNVMKFSSPEFDALFNSYTGATEESERKARLGEALQLLVKNPPAVWLVRPPQVAATRHRVKVHRSGSLPQFFNMEPVQ